MTRSEKIKELGLKEAALRKQAQENGIERRKTELTLRADAMHIFATVDLPQLTSLE